MSTSESLTALVKVTDGTHKAIRSGGTGVVVSGDGTADGKLSRVLKADPRHNEEGGTEVCRILISRLNRDGAGWSSLEREPEQDSNVDYRVSGADGLARRLGGGSGESPPYV